MHIETYQDEAGEWRWRMRARNGEVIAVPGEGYRELAQCHLASDRVCAVGLILSWRSLLSVQPEPFTDVLFLNSRTGVRVLGFQGTDGTRMYTGRVPSDFTPDYFLAVPSPVVNLEG